jgi:hypothetical protein
MSEILLLTALIFFGMGERLDNAIFNGISFEHEDR